VHIPPQEKNKTSYGQTQNANATPEVYNKEMLPNTCQNIDDHLTHPNGKHADQIPCKGIEAKEGRSEKELRLNRSLESLEKTY